MSKDMSTAGMQTLAGDPKKAILKLGLPLMVAMVVQNMYNIVDMFWVSGLGSDALAAVGFVFPFFFASIALATGLGIGGGSAISRKLGAKDKSGADNVAVHMMLVMLVTSILFSVPLFLFAEPIFIAIGAGDTVDMAVSYGKIIFAGNILIFFPNVANAILRSEGDTKRAMNAMILGAVLNIILDPIMIYTLKMGVAGAAWATVISLGVTAAMMANWLFLRKDTYISFEIRKFKFDAGIIKDILVVGLPATVQQASMALMMLVMNLIVIAVSNTDGVAVYTVGWRVVTLAISPLMGISTAVVTMSGYAFGEKTYKKLETSYAYATKVSFLVEAGIAAITFIFASWIAYVFTMSEGSAHISDDLVVFLRIICLFYPMTALGMLSSSLFQGIGKGFNSLAATILRTLVFVPGFAAIFAIYLDQGLTGVWWGIVVGNILGSSVLYAWARTHIKDLVKKEAKATGREELS